MKAATTSRTRTMQATRATGIIMIATGNDITNYIVHEIPDSHTYVYICVYIYI